jgi:hypothetical protein
VLIHIYTLISQATTIYKVSAVTVSLIDFSNTIIVFTNIESIIKKYNIITKKLLVFRPLYLTNSIPILFIINYFTT